MRNLKSRTRFLEDIFCPTSRFQIKENLPPLISCYFVTKIVQYAKSPVYAEAALDKPGSWRQALGWERSTRGLTVREPPMTVSPRRGGRINNARAGGRAKAAREEGNRKGKPDESSGMRWHHMLRLSERLMTLAPVIRCTSHSEEVMLLVIRAQMENVPILSSVVTKEIQ